MKERQILMITIMLLVWTALYMVSVNSAHGQAMSFPAHCNVPSVGNGQISSSVSVKLYPRVATTEGN